MVAVARRTIAARWAAAFIAVLSLSYEAFGDTVTFRAETYVKGPTLTLGDLADIAGERAEELAAVEVAPAAMPQGSKRLDTALVMARLRHAGIDTDGLSLKGARAVRATTLHQEVTPAMIADSLRRFIENAMPWDPQATTIHASEPTQVLIVRDGELGLEWRPNPEYHYLGTGAFRGEVTVDGTSEKSLLCKVDVRTYAGVLVAKQDIARGRPLAAANLEVQEREMSALSEAVLTDLSEAGKYTARRNIYAGQVIAKSQVAPRVLVKRRQVVAVETWAGGLVIRTRARAEADGAEGDVIACKNLTSNQQFYGMVRADGSVLVR